MRDHDIRSVEERAIFIEEVHACTGGKVDPQIIDAALDAVPDEETLGFVVVWMPYREGDYVAKRCLSRLGVAWYTWRARRQRSMFCFVLDVEMAYRDAWGGDQP